MRKVLIVDDNTLNLKILKNILQNEYEVLEATNGKEALDILYDVNNSISAVLLDIIMPVMDGYEVLSAMRENEELLPLPVIVTTGSGELGSEVKALSLGANDYILKPYNPDIIKRRLWNTINLRETASILNAIRIDALTGFLSRAAFFERAEEMIAEWEPGYYIMSCFDIDGFKIVNDQYGTAKGDAVLRYIASIFRDGFERIGGICCRIMADNFAVLYPRDSISKAELDEIWQAAAKLDGSIPPLTYSIGRYIVNDTSLSASAMYDRASIAKDTIKGRYDVHIALYDESMLNRILKEQEIISEMKLALENGNFEVWFQPQYNHSSGAIIGAEALVRWRHPIKGLIPPSDFIPVFEKNGFIYELDKYVWEHTCKYLRNWLDRGHAPLPISVNISRYDVFRSDLLEVLTGLIKKYDIPVDLLRLEITESAFAKSAEIIVSAVKKLMNHGFTVEIDDFGSGYSSLNTLKDVPANVLKLDMRFLENSDNPQRGGNILESIVRMAKWLSMTVIAEGVETIQQADYLSSIGCNYVQGYLYAKPIPVNEYEELYKYIKNEEHLLTLDKVKNLDNNQFWDPKSLDSLIFNNYIGGTCIFEYHNDNIEIVKANNKYAKVLDNGNGKLTLEDVLKLSWDKLLDKNNRSIMYDSLKKAIKTNNEITCELECDNLPGNNKPTHLKTTVRPIASAGDRYLISCTKENITKQREAENQAKLYYEQIQAILDNVESGISASVIDRNNICIIFASDKYYEILGYTKHQYQKEIKNTLSLIVPEDIQTVRLSIQQAFITQKQVIVEYRARKKDNSLIWLSNSILVTNFVGIQLPVFISIINDITADKNAQSIVPNEEQPLLFSETTHKLFKETDPNIGIVNAIRIILDYFDSFRAYIVEIDNEKYQLTSTYEIYQNRISNEKYIHQNISFDALVYWLTELNNNKYVYIKDINLLNSDRQEEKKIISSQGIKSLVAFPLKRNNKLIGFIRIDEPNEHLTQIKQLDTITDYISLMLNCRDIKVKNNSYNELIYTLMNNTPYGFIRMQVLPNNMFTPVYINNGFCQLVDMSYDEVYSKYKTNAYLCVHPNDVEIMQNSVKKMLSSKKIKNIKCRLRHGNSGYICLMMSGQMIKSELDEVFLNMYFTDTNTKNKLEEQKKELLDNLPFSVGIYDYINDNNINIIYLNNKYIELTGHNNENNVSILDDILPEDKSNFISLLSSITKNSPKAECDISIKYADGDYHSMHLSAHLIKCDDGKSAVYIAYNQITEHSKNISKILPSTFEAMIKASPEIAFVKDRNFYYICCSQAFVELTGMTNKSDIIGKNDYELLDKKFAEQYTAIDIEIIESGKPKINYVTALPDDKCLVRYVTTSKYPLHDSDGNIIGIYGIGRDITEERTTCEQLKMLTDSIQGGIAVYEYKQDNIRVVQYNNTYLNIIGYTKQEFESLVANNPIDIIYQEDRQILIDQLHETIENNSSINCNYRIKTKQNECKWINLKGDLAKHHQNITIINVVVFDITDQILEKEQIRIKEEEIRFALSQMGKMILIYDIQKHTLVIPDAYAKKHCLPSIITNIPNIDIEDNQQNKQCYITAFNDFYKAIQLGEKNCSFDAQIQCADASWSVEHAESITLFDNSSKPIKAIISIEDITQSKHLLASIAAEKVLEEQRANKYERLLFDAAVDRYADIIKVDLNSFDTYRINFENGIPVEKDIKQKWDTLYKFIISHVHEDDQKMVLEKSLYGNLEKIPDKSGITITYRSNIYKNCYRWYTTTLRATSFYSGSSNELSQTADKSELLLIRSATAFTIDITDDMIEREKLMDLSEHDGLTDLFNKIKYNIMLKNEYANLKSCGVLFFDVNYLKETNDTKGHEAGNVLLCQVADSIRSITNRRIHGYRYGGDEFVVIVCNSTVKELDNLLNMWKNRLRALSRDSGIPCSVAAGKAWARSPLSVDSLIDIADKDMYKNKKIMKQNHEFL